MAIDYSSILGDASKLSLGPANMYWDVLSGGTSLYLGEMDALELDFGVVKAPLVTAQGGTEPQDQVVTGSMCTLKFGMAQASLDRLAQMIQGFTVRTSGTAVTGFSFADSIGQRDSNIVKCVKIILIRDGIESTSQNDHIYVWRVAPAASAKSAYDAKNQRFIPVEMRAYKDSTRLNSLGAPTFFGNGTI